MIHLSPIFRFICLGILVLLIACDAKQSPHYPIINKTLSADIANTLSDQIRNEVNVTLDPDLELNLWASDSLVTDPIAISVAPDGRIYYTSAGRQSNSEFDIRGHHDWMVASISFQTIEDRQAFLRETFSADSEQSTTHLKDLNEDGVRDWRDLTVEKEQVWVVGDSDKDGVAEQANLFIEDFHEEITDVANGVEYHDGKVYISVGPDLWSTVDLDGDDIADQTTSLARGFAVHIGFGGHGMSGVTVGPDGRLYWGIGDIGMNLVDQDGKNWKYPNRGVIVRSEMDGSGFEVFCMGVRNTHEFTFDKYGNLITEDNDGDHSGESERLTYLIDGSDTGWRINWQFGKYTDPKNNDYKVWMDEKLYVPHWDGQAAYILPPIQNYVNGPTGFVYNPGTALSPEWYEHFFVAEFRGTPSNSPIHAFTLKPDGAGFALDETKEIVSGLLPTGIDFGPDGALYFGDWIHGWAPKSEGRIWKVDVKEGTNSAIRQETKKLIETDFSKLDIADLTTHLAHQDMRVRQKAQFELADRTKEGYDALLKTARSSSDQLARIHGLWGMSQHMRVGLGDKAHLAEFLNDSDEEIIAQALKLIGDVHYEGHADEITGLVLHTNPRIAMYATQALGRNQHASAVPNILKLVDQTKNQDMWLRMAAMVALGRIADEQQLVAQASATEAVQLAAVVGLRRMESAGVALFLKSKYESVATEAARAINDDFSIEGAMGALAAILTTTSYTNEALIRRSINANLRVGEKKNIEQLITYAANTSAPSAMRAEAIATLSHWRSPSVFDRVDGRYRGERTLDDAPLRELYPETALALIKENNDEVQIAAAKSIGLIGLETLGDDLFAVMRTDASADVRVTALQSLYEIGYPKLTEVMQIAQKDKSNTVRSKVLELLPQSGLPESEILELLEKIYAEGSTAEKQAALSSYASYETPESVAFLAKLMDQLESGNLNKSVQLDVMEAIKSQNNTELVDRLTAYESAKDQNDPLSLYSELLYGGDTDKGRRLFYRNSAAQCIRCHAVFEYGGNAGPVLEGVGGRLSRESLLLAMVAPSAEFSMGYEVATITMKDESSHTGIITARDPSEIALKVGQEDLMTLSTADIADIESIPSSMPDMTKVLEKEQIRDLVAFLHSLQDEEG